MQREKDESLMSERADDDTLKSRFFFLVNFDLFFLWDASSYSPSSSSLSPKARGDKKREGRHKQRETKSRSSDSALSTTMFDFRSQ
jgi:hypothetical protein